MQEEDPRGTHWTSRIRKRNREDPDGLVGIPPGHPAVIHLTPQIEPPAPQWPSAHVVHLPGPAPVGEVDLTLAPYLLATRAGPSEIH